MRLYVFKAIKNICLPITILPDDAFNATKAMVFCF